MVVLGVGLRLVQEAKADTAAAKLQRMISVTATVIRDGQPREIAVSRLVPGDFARLAAGDMIPGDVRLVEAKDLFVNQGTLTHRRMDYSVSRHQNTPIGSGAVESAVRRVINLRVKRNATYWLRDNAECMCAGMLSRSP